MNVYEQDNSWLEIKENKVEKPLRKIYVRDSADFIEAFSFIIVTCLIWGEVHKKEISSLGLKCLSVQIPSMAVSCAPVRNKLGLNNKFNDLVDLQVQFLLNLNKLHGSWHTL